MNYSENDFISATRHCFEFHAQRFAEQAGVPLPPLTENTRLFEHIDHAACNLALSVYHEAYGYPRDAQSPAARVVEWHVEHIVPSTWWDAFKLHFALRWWMRWWLKRHPVKYTTTRKDFREVVTARVMLPEVPVKGPRYVWMMTGGRAYQDGLDGAKCCRCNGLGYTESDFPMHRFAGMP